MFQSLLFDMQHEYFQEKNVLTFDPILEAEGGCKDRICLACCCIRHSLYFDMQHDHVMKKKRILTF